MPPQAPASRGQSAARAAPAGQCGLRFDMARALGAKLQQHETEQVVPQAERIARITMTAGGALLLARRL